MGTSPNIVQRPAFLVILIKGKEDLPSSPLLSPKTFPRHLWQELHHMLTPKPITDKGMGSISPHTLRVFP